MRARMPFSQLALALVFFTSGAVSLVFQVAWQRLLTLSYGVGPISVTLIVSVYMFGLGFGSLLGGALAERVKRRMALYLLLELGLGAFGLLSLSYLSLLGQATAGCSHLVSFLCLSLFLCAPTLAMGMTLPLLVKIFNGPARDFGRTVALLYFVNTLGAAFGALLSSYVLISLLGLDRAVIFASYTDFVLAGIIGLVYLTQRSRPTGVNALAAVAPANTPATGLGRWAYALVLVTGFVAIGYEIICFRVLQVLVKDCTYAFSSILAVYLTGIALGSCLMSRYLRRRPDLDKKRFFFLLQFLLGVSVLAIFIGYYHLTQQTRFGALTRLSFGSDRHPALWYPPDLATWQKYFLSLDIFFWPALFVLMPAALMGASFPLVSALALTGEDEGRTVGRVFFWVTVGNVLGGILTGFVLLPELGTEVTLFALAGLSVGFLALGAAGRLRWLRLAARLAVCGVVLAAGYRYFPARGQLYAVMHTPPPPGWQTYFEEGLDGTVMTYRQGEVVDNYINGQIHGGRPGYCFYREAVEALAYARRADKILVIGFGTGSIVEAALKVPNAQVTLVEISQTLLKNLDKMDVFHRTLADPRVEVVIDDGRRFLHQSQEQFDLILIDPLRTTTAYSNNLYSQEFFDLARRRMSPGGVFLLWTEDFSVLPRTLQSAFPEVRVYNYFCLASNEPFHPNRSRQEVILAGFAPNERQGIVSFPAQYVGGAKHIAETCQGAPINRDWRPNCEYFLGMHWRPRLEHVREVWTKKCKRCLGLPWTRTHLIQRLGWGGAGMLGLIGAAALLRRRRRVRENCSSHSGPSARAA